MAAPGQRGGCLRGLRGPHVRWPPRRQVVWQGLPREGGPCPILLTQCAIAMGVASAIPGQGLREDPSPSNLPAEGVRKRNVKAPVSSALVRKWLRARHRCAPVLGGIHAGDTTTPYEPSLCPARMGGAGALLGRTNVGIVSVVAQGEGATKRRGSGTRRGEPPPCSDAGMLRPFSTRSATTCICSGNWASDRTDGGPSLPKSGGNAATTHGTCSA